MNEKDKEILKSLLKRNASKKEIAKKMKITEIAVRKRIKNLENKGILLGFKAVVNYRKADLPFSITGLDVEPEKLLVVIEKLRVFDEIVSIYLSSGDHTIILEILCDTMEELRELHEKINKMDGVKRICPAIVTELIK
ncbi:MAG: Lrp/AsnC ligand binding domain-containing protein [Candidatus Aenigmatarchaeota archaeon]